MDKILLILCNGLSCFIIGTMLFWFMDGRYKRSISGKGIYIVAEGSMVGLALYVNLIGNSLLNLLVWVASVAVAVYFLYYEDMDRPLRRILECEALLFYMSVCESLGVLLMQWLLQLAGIQNIDDVMRYCLGVAFSKIILIFLYYMLINRFMKKRDVSPSRTRYVIYGIMLVYSLVNMLVIVENFRNGQRSYLSAVNMGCIVLADLYLLYFVKMADEKNHYENQIRALEQQSKLQHAYYAAQNRKYEQTVHILHDVKKHIRAIEGLCGTGEENTAGAYAREIGKLLKPLVPVRYTENPILNILLTDKEVVMREKEIRVEIMVDDVNLEFLAPVDVTTIFGNLLDNAIEAAEKVDGDRYVSVRISAYHQMIVVRMENSCNDVTWKNGVPVSDKGEGRGIGLLNVRGAIEKYDGNLRLEQEGHKFIVEFFLNS